MKAKHFRPRIIGYEIRRRVEPGEVPGYPLDPGKDRAVLGAREQRYLVPPDVDVFELGLIDRPGPHELLPVGEDDKPLWDAVIHLLVGEAEAARQRELLRMAYRALCGMITEADELEAVPWSPVIPVKLVPVEPGGDTDQHGITAVGLAKANPGVPDWTKLTAGQRLLIPAH